MLRWNAKFQIPNSGIQVDWVFLYASVGDLTTDLLFYSDIDRQHLLFQKTIDFIETDMDVYDFLLSLDEYNNYERVK